MIKLLSPKMQEKTFELFKFAISKSWKPIIDAARRSPERQKWLYTKWEAGRFKCPLVAKTGSSTHEYGCAVDILLLGEEISAYIEIISN